jgi:acyl-homoserine lactone acylase PvdQ
MGKWKDMRIIEETIPIKGNEPHKTKILLTHHGPILTDISSDSEKESISGKWAFNEGIQPAKAVYLLAKAKNFEV